MCVKNVQSGHHHQPRQCVPNPWFYGKGQHCLAERPATGFSTQKTNEKRYVDKITNKGSVTLYGGGGEGSIGNKTIRNPGSEGPRFRPSSSLPYHWKKKKRETPRWNGREEHNGYGLPLKTQREACSRSAEPLRWVDYTCDLCQSFGCSPVIWVAIPDNTFLYDLVSDVAAFQVLAAPTNHQEQSWQRDIKLRYTYWTLHRNELLRLHGSSSPYTCVCACVYGVCGVGGLYWCIIRRSYK